ncbi:hypothetical protein Bbelb_324020 [Branchiostoma belcheri]|nr:hypothetical protein Bbelb_324020 [Branchiostoma belcheri]
MRRNQGIKISRRFRQLTTSSCSAISKLTEGCHGDYGVALFASSTSKQEKDTEKDTENKTSMQKEETKRGSRFDAELGLLANRIDRRENSSLVTLPPTRRTC